MKNKELKSKSKHLNYLIEEKLKEIQKQENQGNLQKFIEDEMIKFIEEKSYNITQEEVADKLMEISGNFLFKQIKKITFDTKENFFNEIQKNHSTKFTYQIKSKNLIKIFINELLENFNIKNDELKKQLDVKVKKLNDYLQSNLNLELLLEDCPETIEKDLLIVLTEDGDTVLIKPVKENSKYELMFLNKSLKDKLFAEYMIDILMLLIKEQSQSELQDDNDTIFKKIVENIFNEAIKSNSEFVIKERSLKNIEKSIENNMAKYYFDNNEVNFDFILNKIRENQFTADTINNKVSKLLSF